VNFHNVHQHSLFLLPLSDIRRCPVFIKSWMMALGFAIEYNSTLDDLGKASLSLVFYRPFLCGGLSLLACYLLLLCNSCVVQYASGSLFLAVYIYYFRYIGGFISTPHWHQRSYISILSTCPIWPHF